MSTLSPGDAQAYLAPGLGKWGQLQTAAVDAHSPRPDDDDDRTHHLVSSAIFDARWYAFHFPAVF